jgi:hypothetical protein
MRTLEQVIEQAPGLPTELGRSRDLPAAMISLLYGEIDAGFGRVYPTSGED